MKPFVLVALPPPGSVTTTLTGPTDPAGGVSDLKVVLDTNVVFVPSADPNLTVTPATKLVPVIVTVSPPLYEPDVGEIDEIVGPPAT